MRAKTTDFLKVLNRAKPEPKVVERKTMAGKTFQQAKWIHWREHEDSASNSAAE